jgi:RNA ligase (TIGR02306 family)
MSTHSVRIIEISEVRSHPNADRLEIVPIRGWQCVVGKGQFKPGDRAVYIEPDYTVPVGRREFAFLARPQTHPDEEHRRLRAIRLRNVLSFGLLIPVPEFLRDRPLGSDVMLQLGIRRYEPPLNNPMGLPFEECPKTFSSKFDVESYQNFMGVLQPGEEVIVTEKIDGGNGRYLFENGVFYMGSRSDWLDPTLNHPWSIAAKRDPRIRTWCEAHEGDILYGEVFGSVQSLRYGRKNGEIDFAAFAVLRHGEWIDTLDLLHDETVPTAPLLYVGPFSPAVFDLAEKDSCVPGAPAGHLMEGVVIVPKKERRDLALGRVSLKHISNRFWESGN